jgi:TRAP-type mannitol/chloroaromatic compound transport system substrate-binding protein
MKKLVRCFLLAAVAFCFLLAGLSSGAHAQSTKVFKWRLQSSHGPAFITYRLLEQKLKELKMLSGGRLDIALYPANAIVPNFELFASLSKGTIDSFHSFPGYWGGIDPGLPPFCNYPMGMNGEDYMTWLYQYGGLDMIRKFYAKYKIHIVGMWGQGVEPINSRKPLNGVDDVKGTKGRMGGQFVDVIKAMGGTTVMVATPEAYTALQTGVIDWADAGDIVSNWDMGLQEVCPYLILPGWQQTTSMATISVNMSKWNELPEDLKLLFTMAVRSLAEELREAEDWQSAVIMEKHRKRGTKIIVWSDKELAKVAQIVRKLEKEKWMKQSPLLAEVITSMNNFWQQFGPYKFSVLTKRPD